MERQLLGNGGENNFKKTRQFQRIGAPENFKAMKQAERESAKTNKKARIETWKQKCSTFTRETSITEVWKLTKHFATGKRCTSARIKDAKLLKMFVDKNSKPDNEEEINFDEFESVAQPFKLIGFHELKHRIQTLKKSACGTDRINAKILKELPNLVIHI